MQRVRRPLQTLYIIPQKIKSPAVTKHRVYKKKKKLQHPQFKLLKKTCTKQTAFTWSFSPQGEQTHTVAGDARVVCVSGVPSPSIVPPWMRYVPPPGCWMSCPWMVCMEPPTGTRPVTPYQAQSAKGDFKYSSAF